MHLFGFGARRFAPTLTDASGPLAQVVAGLRYRYDPARAAIAALTSTVAGEGVTTMAAALASMLAGGADRSRWVVLLDASGGAPVPQSALPRGVVVQSLGGMGGAAAELEALRAAYATVILDLPPLLNGPVAAELASLADVRYLVVRAGATRAGDVRRAIDHLGRTRIDGVLLNGARRGAPRWLTRMVA